MLECKCSLYRTPKDCCKALLEDWVTTDNGAKPKTWRRLIEALSEIEELEPVMDYIKQKLMSEGVTFECTYVSMHVCMAGMYVCTYVCIYVYMYVCMYICIYVCVCVCKILLCVITPLNNPFHVVQSYNCCK